MNTNFNFRYSGLDGASNALLGQLYGMGAGMIVLCIALVVFSIVCLWRVFEKAGEPGWKSLIPIYNAYILLKISWEGKILLYEVLGAVLVALLVSIGAAADSAVLSGIGSFLTVVYYVAVFVVGIISEFKLAKRFGKGGGFAVGLILLNFIFMAILAFDDSVYDRSAA